MAKKIHFPKGEGIKIIQQESEAKVPDTIYIRSVDKQTAEIIVVSKSGIKRKVGFSIPDNFASVDLFDSDGNITKEGNVYLKEQIDNMDFYKKVEDPGDGKTYLLKIDGTAVDASGFGKVDKVMNVSPDANKNVDISGVAMNWKNPNQRFSGITNKSLDVTFDRIAVFDSDKNLGWSNGANLMVSATSALSEAQRLSVGTNLNGGFSTGTISVGEISPKFIDKTINASTWILIRGANLNFNPNNFSVKILDSAGNIVATIDNSHVQLFTSGLDLSFYFNFSTLPQGVYKINLWNGVFSYIAPYTISVTSELQTINTNALTWNVLKENDFNLLANGSSVSFSDNRSTLTSLPNVVASAKSSRICEENENVYVEFDLRYDIKNESNQGNRYSQPLSLSFISDTTNNQLQYLNLSEGLQVKYAPDNVPRMYYFNTDTWFNVINRSEASAKMILVRENNMLSIFLTTSIVSPNQTYSKSINIAPNQPLSILAQFPADIYRGIASISILRAYKF